MCCWEHLHCNEPVLLAVLVGARLNADGGMQVRDIVDCVHGRGFLLVYISTEHFPRALLLLPKNPRLRLLVTGCPNKAGTEKGGGSACELCRSEIGGWF